MSYIMKRPQSPGKISVKTLIAMLVFLKVPNEVLSCTNCGSKIDNILTSEITISEASNCTVNFPEVKVHQVTPKGNDLIVSNLQPGTSYNLSINCSTVCCLQFTTGPDVIRNLTFTQISTSSVSLSWTEPQGKSSFYRVEWDDTEWNGRTVFMNKTTNQTSVNITGLTAGAQYTFAIIAVAEDRNSEGVSVNKMQYTRPDVIRNLTFTQISTSSVSLSWTEPQGKSSFYRVDWDDTVRDGSTVSMNKTTNQTSVNITGLTAGAQYVFSVVAIAADSRTAGDSVQMIRYTRPDVIRTLTFTQISTSSVSLSWTEQQGKSSFYRVEWDDTVRDGSTVFMNKTTNHTSVDIGRLIAGAQYVFSVFVIAGDNKTAGDSISKTQYTRPVKVAIVSGVLEQTGNCSLAIAWTHLGNASSYEVNLTNSALKFQQSKSIIAREASFTGLSPGRIYDVTVTSIAGDLKNTSDIFHFATMPNPVKGLKASPQSTTSVNLTWEPPAGDQLLYKIHVSNSAEPGKDYTEKMVSVLISDLQPGTRYSFTVTPNIANISGPSEVTSGYTYPNPPEGIKVEEQTTSYISISWGRPLSMDPSQYNFTVSQSGHQPVMTAENQALVPNLQSGTQYNISVVTVGPLAYQSMPVWISVTTRPQPVSQLRETEITTSSVTLIWVQPEAKDGYTYGVMVAYPNGTVRNQTVNRPGVRKKGLQSGCSHTFTITTLTADGTPASPRSITITTRPFPIGGLKAITLNTTTVYLNWTQPQKYRPSYSYRVETTGCTSAPKNQSEGSESAYVTDLRSGSNCSFTVYSRVRNDIEGTPVSTSQYTKPDKLTPTVSRSTNDSITVTWESPKGTIEKYVVKLTNSDGENTTEELNSTDQCYRFSGLLAGKAYTVKLNTICGPFSEESEPVLSATYPNQPGPINFNKATTISIYLEWGEAPGMVKGSFNYSVFYELASTIDPTRDQPCNTTTQTNAVNLSDLKSGNIYNISVSSVGPLGFLSQPIRIQVMTKPGSIRHLKVNSTSVEGITLQWEATGDRYRVATENFKIDTELTHYQVKNLTPGTKYTFSVTTLAFDGTEGCQESVTNCTDAAPVTDLTCTGPNLTDAVLVLSWPKPRGANQGFKLHPNNNSLEQCYSNCSHNLTGLLYNKEYTVMIQTLGCGKNSKLTQKVCKTGITVPPVPDTAGMSVTGTEHNRFTLQLSPSLFSDTSGPVRSYGVLVTSDWHSLSGKNKSFLRDYLNKTYDDWTAGSTTTYLAVIKEPENINRNGGSGPVVVVGDGTKSHSYYNGPLGASGTYSFAVVAFTYLDLNKGYVSIATSFFSISKFYHDGIHLPLSPEAIRATVGGTLAALLILILVTVIAAVFWRRLSKKESSDVPMFSIGAKVSAPIRVENYEAYYRQNQAHSNHGFAEQFENLKPVGVAQAKSSAIALDNKGKNRYNNVLPYDSSRVKLSVLGSPYDDYINANFIPGYSSRKEFIAAQGPLPSTVNAFWRMIWEKNVHTLVMLTRCNEMGRVKCEQYWPSGIQHYNSITVTTTSEIPLEDWTMRDFSVKNVKTAETRTVRHFHFTAWPDHGVPETTELLINFRHLVREHMDQYSRHSPTVVHCSAGVGRTGTFIAIDRLIYQIERDSMVDVYGVVHDLRMHRPLMVQTEDQFVFLNQCALDIIRSRTGTNVDLIYQNTAALSIYANCETVKSKNGYHNA